MKNCRITVNPTTKAIFTLQLDGEGNPKLDKNGERFGFIRIEESKVDLNYAYQNGGIKTVSALKAMKESVWEKVKHLYKPNMEIDGKIQVIETTDVNIHKNGVGTGFQAKRAGKLEDGTPGELLTIGGEQIFRSTNYTTDVNAEDVLIKHDNVLTPVQKAKTVAKQALNA